MLETDRRDEYILVENAFKVLQELVDNYRKKYVPTERWSTGKIVGNSGGTCECGASVFDSMKFCRYCGNELDWSDKGEETK